MFKTQLLYQNDNRWKSLTLGNSPEIIGKWGGLLTSITMMLNGLGYTETPATVNEKLKKAGGFLKSLPGPSQVANAWPNCVYCGMTTREESSFSIAEIDEAVAAGKPVILEVDSSEETGSQTHFVLVKRREGNDYVLYDPYRSDGDRPDQEVLLTKRYKYNGARLEAEISAVLWFDRRSLEPPLRFKSARLPIPAEKFKLFVTEDNVMLRDGSSRGSFPWKLMDQWTDLICLESKAAAKFKMDKARAGAADQWILAQHPDGEQGYVSAQFVTADLPDLSLLSADIISAVKKWCLKNLSIQNSQFWDGEGNPLDLKNYTLPKSFSTLRKNTVISVLNSTETIPGWTRILYREKYHEKKSRTWVTAQVTGWVSDADLDDYFEPQKQEVPDFVVTIDRQTESLTDAQQYFYMKDERGERVRYNMCGQLCVAAILGKHIDSVLDNWREKSKAMYDNMIGLADKPLGPRHIENLLDVHGVPYERYKYDKDMKPREKYENLADPEGDRRLASEELDVKLKEHYFITNLRIDTNTGDLQAAYSAEDRNHWVVVERVTRNRSRVELYNPYPNRLEEYTFGEFYRAVGGNPNSGWWVKKDAYPNLATHSMKTSAGLQAQGVEAGPNKRQKITGRKRAPAGENKDESASPAEAVFQAPVFEVAIDNRTVNPDDAEQYMSIRGEGSRPKTKLCGEFCVTFILGQSLDTALTRWLGKQKQLKKQGKQTDLWELATLLQAYGFNRRKYLAPEKGVAREPDKYYVAPKSKPDIASSEHGFKSFSIDTVLEYWKGVHPDLYNSLLGGDRNEPTGPEDLITILKAYGYSKGDYSYYRPGSKEVFGYAPGRDAEVIGKTHYLLAGVNIHGSTGRLQPSGVAHWVVVTKITPRGNLVGGNGGWVELYNPFPNCWEEYSYREFMDAFRGMGEGSTLWIKTDVDPNFAWQAPAPAKIQGRTLKSSGRVKGNKKDEKKGKGNKAKDKGRKGFRLPVIDDEPPLDANQLACDRLDVDAMPRAIGMWLRDTANEDRFFAETLIDTLLECGLLSIRDLEIDGKKTRAALLSDLVFSDGPEAVIKKSTDNLAASPQDPVSRVGRTVLPLLLPRVIEEIKEIQKEMSVHAYQPRAVFRAWTRGLACQFKDPLETMIKERLERLPVSAQDRPDIFRVCKIILTRFTSGAVEEEIEKIQQDSALMDQIKNSWELNHKEELNPNAVREWILALASGPRKKVYRVRKWGDEEMKDLGFGVSKLHDRGEGSNFQAVGLYNTATGFGAISNYLIIPREDVLMLEALQVEDEYEQKRKDWLRQKMNWLCQHRGSIYMFAENDSYRGDWSWRRPEGIRWGTIALGGNLVQVAGFDELEVKLPEKNEVVLTQMARLIGFKSTDWGRPLDELLEEGLVHRCFCVYKGNDIGDSPQGIVYSPFWSPEEWEFRPKTQGAPAPTELWIPAAYLEEVLEETPSNI